MKLNQLNVQFGNYFMKIIPFSSEPYMLMAEYFNSFDGITSDLAKFINHRHLQAGPAINGQIRKSSSY